MGRECRRWIWGWRLGDILDRGNGEKESKMEIRRLGDK
jgi:hypothetical protein